MLQTVCEFINNYFVREEEVWNGTYAIADGTLSPLPPLKDGQRFLISGSDLNDGVYTYHADGIRNDDDTAGAGLADETFYGAVCGLSVPPQVTALAAEITSWVEKYGDVINSPYQSESFGGYSYTRASNGRVNQNGGTGAAGWQDVFAPQLKRWRKVNFLC